MKKRLKHWFVDLLRPLPDGLYCRLYYLLKLRKIPHFRNPKTFNEKINWRKLYDRNPIYTKLADKYEVRKYVADKIGAEHLVPLLGVWDKVEEIDFEKLPKQFVLKCTHDCGSVVICKDKERFDFEAAKEKLGKALKRNWYWEAREWQYTDMSPRIIAEEYLVDESGEELKDYKFYCFGEKVVCVEAMFHRFHQEGLRINIYDERWNLLPVEIKYPSDTNMAIEKPQRFDEMLSYAKMLGKDFSFVRVDFYQAKNQIYFGELTFTPGGVVNEFNPEKYDALFGKEWVL
jgi:hypothetical protein